MADESPEKHDKLHHAVKLEREAHEFRSQNKIDEAFHAFDKAARLFRAAGDSFKAAICFASAATCWNQHTGYQSHHHAASRSEYAAFEALKLKDYAYADSLFRQAALLYEKEGDYHHYSRCYIHAEDAHLSRLWQVSMTGHATHLFGDLQIDSNIGFIERVKALLSFIPGLLSKIVWGYGEKPVRTLVCNALVIILSAAVYYESGLVQFNGIVRVLDFWEALYFSAVTFTTVGYGDFLPLGWVRGVAAAEAFCGVVLMPLFLIGLTRRYLRMNR